MAPLGPRQYPAHKLGLPLSHTRVTWAEAEGGEYHGCLPSALKSSLPRAEGKPEPGAHSGPSTGPRLPIRAELLARAQRSRADTCEAAQASVSSSENSPSTPPSPLFTLRESSEVESVGAMETEGVKIIEGLAHRVKFSNLSGNKS